MAKHRWLIGVLGLVLLLGVARADDGGWEDAQALPPGAPAVPDAADPAPAEPAVAAPPAKEIKCIVSGLPWLKSSTRVEAIFKVDGQRLRGHFLSLPYMLIERKLLLEDGKDVSVESVSVLDYASFGTDSERMIPVNDDWSNVAMLSTSAELAGSKAPYYAAFSTIEDLDATQKKLGGKPLTYEAVMKRILQALKTEEEVAATEGEGADDPGASMRLRQPKLGLDGE